MAKKGVLGPCTSSRQKMPRALKEHPVMHKFSLSHQPIVALRLIRLAIISLACHAQHIRSLQDKNSANGASEET